MNYYSLLIGLFILAILGLAGMLYPIWRQKKVLILITPILLSLMGLAYWRWGAWQQLYQFQQAQQQQQQVQALLKTMHGPQQLIETMKERLAHDPSSARGWYLLGRLYAGQSQWALAESAFKRAWELKSNDEQFLINYVQSKMMLHAQKLDEESLTLLNALLVRNPQQPDALGMLAMHAYSTGAFIQASEYWQRLLTLVPSQSDEAQMLRKAIAAAEKKITT